MLGVVVTLASVVAQAEGNPDRQQQFLLCQETLQRTAEALRSCASEHHSGNHLPGRIEFLVPDHLPDLPKCPTSGKVYHFVSDWTTPASFALSCPDGHPGYSQEGLPYLAGALPRCALRTTPAAGDPDPLQGRDWERPSLWSHLPCCTPRPPGFACTQPLPLSLP